MVRTTTAVVIIIVIPREKKVNWLRPNCVRNRTRLTKMTGKQLFFSQRSTFTQSPFCFCFQEAPTTPRNSPSSTPTRAPRWSCPQTGEKEGDKKTDILGMLLLSFGFSFPHQHIHACFSFKEAGEVHSADPLSFSSFPIHLRRFLGTGSGGDLFSLPSPHIP